MSAPWQTQWPAEAHRKRQSADLRVAALGMLLFAQWEQARAGLDMGRYAPGSRGWRYGAEQQRRAGRDMAIARAAMREMEKV